MVRAPLEPSWPSAVLDYWFVELGPDGWFARDAGIDATIRERFLELHAQLRGNPLVDFSNRDDVLATVIVLDQFSRNLFRGTREAFASDDVARAIARQAVERGLDAQLRTEQRMFLYLPFEHSEDRDDQSLSVRLIAALGNDEWTRYAVAHQSIIERFGRFPHRNTVLGRHSSAEELALLEQPMGSF